MSAPSLSPPPRASAPSTALIASTAVTCKGTPAAENSLLSPGSRPALARMAGAARSQPSAITRSGRSKSFTGPASAGGAAEPDPAAEALALSTAAEALAEAVGGGGGAGATCGVRSLPASETPKPTNISSSSPRTTLTRNGGSLSPFYQWLGAAPSANLCRPVYVGRKSFFSSLTGTARLMFCGMT